MFTLVSDWNTDFWTRSWMDFCSCLCSMGCELGNLDVDVVVSQSLHSRFELLGKWWCKVDMRILRSHSHWFIGLQAYHPWRHSVISTGLGYNGIVFIRVSCIWLWLNPCLVHLWEDWWLFLFSSWIKLYWWAGINQVLIMTLWLVLTCHLNFELRIEFDIRILSAQDSWLNWNGDCSVLDTVRSFGSIASDRRTWTVHATSLVE